jgi:hypothetical protein
MAVDHIKPLELSRKHYTNEQKEQKRNAEEMTKTGNEMQPTDQVLNNPFALKKFTHMKSIYAAIKNDDEIHSETINRYCMMLQDEDEWICQKSDIMAALVKAKEDYVSDKLGAEEYLIQSDRLREMYIKCDRELKSTRKMLLDIEKSSCLTLADRLRAIPMKPPEKTEEESGIERYKRLKNGG